MSETAVKRWPWAMEESDLDVDISSIDVSGGVSEAVSESGLSDYLSEGVVSSESLTEISVEIPSEEESEEDKKKGGYGRYICCAAVLLVLLGVAGVLIYIFLFQDSGLGICSCFSGNITGDAVRRCHNHCPCESGEGIITVSESPEKSNYKCYCNEEGDSTCWTCCLHDVFILADGINMEKCSYCC